MTRMYKKSRYSFKYLKVNFIYFGLEFVHVHFLIVL